MKKLILMACVLLAGVMSIHAQGIFDAVRSGDLSKVKEIIEKDPQLVKARNANQSTPLHVAVDLGKESIAEYLIEKGSDVNSTNRYQLTPIFYVKKAEIAKLLIECGANFNHTNSNMNSVLMEIETLEVAKILVEKGADINYVNPNNDYTALYLAVWRKRTEIADYLLEKGAVIRGPETQVGQDEFIYSLKAGLCKYLDKYLEKGFSPFIQDESNNSLIHYAAESNSRELITKLIEIGVPIKTLNIFGWTPLHIAVYKKNKNVVEFLMQKGLDKNERTAGGKSPYNLAKEVESNEIADYLISAGADTSGIKFPELMGEYFSQPKPGKKPEVFAPGIVAAQYQYHSTIVFSPDGNEAYWSEWMPTRIHFSKRVNGKWTEPVKFSDGDVPFISPDGKKFYSVDREKKEGSRKEIIYVRDKTDNGWSEPRELSEIVNSIDGIHWQISVDRKENLYFCAFKNNKATIYYAGYSSGKYHEPQIIEELKDIRLFSPYISPDGNYLLASGATDASLHIIFRKKDGSWTERINLSDYFQLKNPTQCSFVTNDGKYLFFTVFMGTKLIPYWVDASFIDDLRKEALKEDK